jgi:putative restriction endonuclease
MLTPEGHTVVEAAHIIPWRISHNDDPRDGLALCRLCHWTFDEGMLAVSSDYLVNASPRLRADPNLPAHLSALDGRGMMRPTDTDYWPATESLDWHMDHVFRRR